MKSVCKIFDAYKTEAAGIWYFIPADGEYKKGVPKHGFGCVKYAEGSVYVGDLYYDGDRFNKIGFGRQDFTRSGIGNIVPDLNERKYKFVGRYDYRKTDWIYGNGVLYYTDAFGKPTHFRKGFFEGLKKTGEYKGEFDFSTLLSGYTADMEFDFDEDEARIERLWRNNRAAAERAKKIDVLFVGDSYFELAADKEFAGENTFDKVFPDTYVDMGIGGSKFSDWIGWADRLDGTPAPEKIIINLGFNDIHAGRGVNNTYNDFITFLGLMRERFPTSKYYLVSAVHSPDSPHWKEQINKYNKKTADCAARNGVSVGEWQSRIDASGANCFHADGIHPNAFGYGLFFDFIKEFLAR